MKWITLGLLVGTIGLTGCFPMDFLRDKPPPEPAPAPVVEKAPRAVTEDEVSAENASAVSKAVRDELEYARRHPVKMSHDD